MTRFKLEFILHWLWAIVFGILLLTGLALMGPKYGWILSYNLALADYLHRTMAAVFTVLFLIEMFLEIRRILLLENKKNSWLILGRQGFALLSFVTTWVLVLSGIYLWYCMDQNHSLLALAALLHEGATFVMTAGMVWHIYDKSHVLILGGGSNK